MEEKRRRSLSNHGSYHKIPLFFLPSPNLFSPSLFFFFFFFFFFFSGSGGGVSSQLVFQTQSVNKQGKERDFIDLHLNDNEITTPMVFSFFFFSFLFSFFFFSPFFFLLLSSSSFFFFPFSLFFSSLSSSVLLPLPSLLLSPSSQLPPGEYQLLLEGLRLFTGMLGKGIGVGW